jgi:itaconate CoA-transferase
VVGRLEASDIAYGRVNDVIDLLDHPQLADEDRWTEVASNAGAIRMLKPPVRISGVGDRSGPIPAVGEHTDQILAELGWDEGAIERLRRDGAI